MTLIPWKKRYNKPSQHIWKQRHYFANNSPYSQSYGFSCAHVWMWQLDYKESWALKNWCFWTVVLEKTLESPLDSKEIQPVHPKGDQSWIFIGRTDAEVETPNTLATWCEELTHWKKPWCWERLNAEGEGGDRGWDGWMASQTQWTWVWVNSRSWWWTGRPGVLQSMGSQSRTQLSDWTELNVPGVRWVQLCSILTFFGIAFLWDWNENWPFPVLWPQLSFPYLVAYWVQHFHSIIFQDLN